MLCHRDSWVWKQLEAMPMKTGICWGCSHFNRTSCARKWASMGCINGFKRYCWVSCCPCTYWWVHLISWKQNSWTQTKVPRAVFLCQTSTKASLSWALSSDDKVFWPSFSSMDNAIWSQTSFFLSKLSNTPVAIKMYCWLWLQNISWWFLSTSAHRHMVNAT